MGKMQSYTFLVKNSYATFTSEKVAVEFVYVQMYFSGKCLQLPNWQKFAYYGNPTEPTYIGENSVCGDQKLLSVLESAFKPNTFVYYCYVDVLVYVVF
jgi:endo-beta-N-acetylglucosaminidase D